jgi:AraC-like DNA-binding protein
MAGDRPGATVSLERATSVEDYVANPFGRYIAGPTYVAYWSSAHTNGITFWGRPDEEHLRSVTRALDAVLVPGRPHHRVLIDARDLAAVDVRAFAIMANYMVKNRATHARLCTRQALVRPNGLPGAVVAGFYALVNPGYPVQVFDDAQAALGWLDIPEDSSLLTEVGRIRTLAADDAASFLSEIRAYLDREQGRATLPQAASALAVSERTLQRRLRDGRSSFRDEVAAAQLRLAMDLLSHGTDNVNSVATQVGYASPSQFRAFFRRLTGQSPAEWLSEWRRSSAPKDREGDS